MVSFTVAAAQYPIDQLGSWEAYEAKLTRWVEEAAAQGAKLAVFPEYGAMELASLDPATMGDLAGSIETVSALLPRVDALHADLARRPTRLMAMRHIDFDAHLLEYRRYASRRLESRLGATG